MTKADKFWLVWCGGFAVLDVVFGVLLVLRGEPSRAGWEFLFAVVMVLCFASTWQSARRRQRVRECLLGWKFV